MKKKVKKYYPGTEGLTGAFNWANPGNSALQQYNTTGQSAATTTGDISQVAGAKTSKVNGKVLNTQGIKQKPPVGGVEGFMGNYGGAIAQAAGSLMPLLMKKPDPNAKPYKKGSKLIKYEGGDENLKAAKKNIDPNKVVDTSQFTDPTVKALFREYMKNNKGAESGSALTPLETLRVGVPSQQQTDSAILAEQEAAEKKITSENKGKTKEKGEVENKGKEENLITYSPTQSGILGTTAATLKGLTKWKGKGKRFIVPTANFALKALPFGTAASNWFNDKSEGFVNKAKNVGLQTLGDISAMGAGLLTSKATGNYIRKRKEEIKTFNEKMGELRAIQDPAERSKMARKMKVPSRFNAKSFGESVKEEAGNMVDKLTGIPDYFSGLFNKLTSENKRELRGLQKERNKKAQQIREERKKTQEASAKSQKEQNKKLIAEENAKESARNKARETKRNTKERNEKAEQLMEERWNRPSEVERREREIEEARNPIRQMLINWNAPKASSTPSVPLVLAPPPANPSPKRRSRKK